MAKWLALTFLLGLVFCSPAGAKGPNVASLCGAGNCATVRDIDSVNHLALYDGFRQRGVPRVASYFTVELTSSRLRSVDWQFVYVPSRWAIRVDRADFGYGPSSSYWVTPTRRALKAYTLATRGVMPYPMPTRWTSVVVNRASMRRAGGLDLRIIATGSTTVVACLGMIGWYRRRVRRKHLVASSRVRAS
jgi:hypothetical protein